MKSVDWLVLLIFADFISKEWIRLSFPERDCTMSYIERKSELKRKRKRRATVTKLKAKLAATKNPTDQQAIVAKIKKVSPLWKPID